MDDIDSRIQSHQLHQLPHPSKTKQNKHVKTDGRFEQLLKTEMNADHVLKLSKHAEQRIASRGITISSSQWNVIEEKLNEAKHKGITDSLIVMKDAALVVSVENDTVVTAMDRNEAESQLFTNINGAILI
ncbi:TIGR02530 family flagellar biosynthesis protein [Desertibacillus haloalkaliphilus]|uniref:TIGR02530 family flagellar biosynthesis protein n=1 Tax=Desertibacillus haloalkaliphilus TaxID=1328930 RepID=UPI001C266662|nr:TIGR02530 family flagellar biosynthesis protein [Desertibacillus haloalkaliphilus]MBU8907007.1 flagellar protein [Desertibacillus haloalkaliphilus]